MRAIKPWTYNLRPNSFGPKRYPMGPAAIRKLVAQCQQDDDGVYRLEGTTFRMTINHVGERMLWK
ncbi:hypothetical protein LCGC14_0609990 [marine sediment metagenome]|uniref:Uncharacterized protein n=1 Tax=marine sediment metagenome TaxID=412755 RepID=A0A0F9UGG8_9ZZZZ